MLDSPSISILHLSNSYLSLPVLFPLFTGTVHAFPWEIRTWPNSASFDSRWSRQVFHGSYGGVGLEMLDARIAFQREIAPGTLTFPRDRQMEPRHVNPRFRWDRVTGNHQRSFHEQRDSKVSRLLDGDDPTNCSGNVTSWRSRFENSFGHWMIKQDEEIT